MATSRKRKVHERNNSNTYPSSTNDWPKTFPNNPTSPATEEDRDRWNGFCEIESDPAFFNVMLRDFGIKGVKVQEVFGLDNDLLAMLPQPVYGLIFLFRWIEDDPGKQEPSCPEGVWFANQTVGNACATVALLNIVNNIPDLELGDLLEQFKTFTKDFSPALRGDQISHFQFVKRIHNSFARKMDMLNCDLALKNELQSKRLMTGKSDFSTAPDDEIDANYHFIAFVPIDGHLWRLDGLERQPQNLGNCEVDDWLSLATPHIESRIKDYEGGHIEFSLLSLVRDPLFSLRVSLAANVKNVQELQRRLENLEPSWRASDWVEALITEGLLQGPDVAYGLKQADIDTSQLSDDVKHLLLEGTAPMMEALWRTLALDQSLIRAGIVDEEQSIRRDDDRAANRRHDYSPFIQKWIRILARKGALKELLD